MYGKLRKLNSFSLQFFLSFLWGDFFFGNFERNPRILVFQYQSVSEQHFRKFVSIWLSKFYAIFTSQNQILLL